MRRALRPANTQPSSVGAWLLWGLGFDRLASELATAVESYPGDPARQLQESGHRYVQLAMQNPQCTQLMFGGILPCDDTYPEFRTSGDSAFDGLKYMIEEGQNQGVFKQGEVELLALAAWSAIHGLSLLLISGNLSEIVTIPVECRSITTAVTTTLLEGLKAH